MESIQAKSSRHDRAVARSRKRQRIEELDVVEEPVNETSLSEVNDSIDAGISTQTDLTMNDMAEDRAKMQDEIDHLKTELEVTREENKKLYETANALKKEGEEYLLNENFLKDKNEKVLFYTGLSTWELFQKLYLYVEPYLKQHSSLSPFQQLLVTLMRLRLNISGQDLGYRFRVHKSTISRTCD